MRRKLLLADDSITIQKVIGITFVKEDVDLTVVDNGDAALEKARADRPDLILADVFMPGKNGYELCAAVKSDPALAGVPVLLLTGTFEPFDEAKAQAAGADGWIAKPFESQTLIARVRDLLEKAAAAAPSSSVPPAVPVAALEPTADIWAEVAAPDAVETAVAAEADFGDIFDAGEPTPAPSAQSADVDVAADDIWGDVSFDEDDLAPVSTPAVAADSWTLVDEGAVAEPQSPVAGAAFAPAPADEFELSEALEEPAALLDEADDLFESEEEGPEQALAAIAAEDDLRAFEELPVSVPAVAADGEEELMELDDEDILILEEEDALTPEASAVSAVAAAVDSDRTVAAVAPLDSAGPLAETEPSDRDIFGDILVSPAADIEAAEEAESAMAAETSFSGVAETGSDFEFETVEAESESLLLEPQALSAELEPFSGTVEPEAVAGEPPAKVPVAAAVESRLQTLSDEELTAIVERVAGAVIERLAGTILEKIAWEVVPDLAESLIKEEIRQIKAAVR